MARTKSIFDTPPDADIEARLDAEAEADVTAGRVVPHERVREWLIKLARGERVPPPENEVIRVAWTRTALRGI